MKLRCIKCKEELYPSKDDIKAIADMIERHKLDVTTFLDSLAPIGGKCEDGDLHIFEFDDIFRDDMHKLAERLAGLNQQLIVTKEEYDKLIKDRKETEDKLKNTIKNIEYKSSDIVQIDKDIERIYTECEDLTGARNIELWSKK